MFVYGNMKAQNHIPWFIFKQIDSIQKMSQSCKTMDIMTILQNIHTRLSALEDTKLTPSAPHASEELGAIWSFKSSKTPFLSVYYDASKREYEVKHKEVTGKFKTKRDVFDALKTIFIG